jgi:putative ABC transport system substrate-binding protein
MRRHALVGLVALVGVTAAIAYLQLRPQRSRRVGVVYLLQHPAIDAGLAGFRQRLAEISTARGVAFDARYANAFGDVKAAAQAVEAFNSTGVGAIVALTTPCAQVAKQKVKDKPVIFVGVSDPVGAGLVDSLEAGKDNIVGTTSRPPYLQILQTAARAFPDIRRIGIVYSAQEANSQSAIGHLETVLPKALPGLVLVTRAVTATAEISATTKALLEVADAIFVLDDNATVSAIDVMVSTASAAHKPIFACDLDSVRRGALFTHGIDYSKEGVAAANLLQALLLDGKKPTDLPVAINEATTFHVNARLFRDYPDVDRTIFKQATVSE